MGKGFVVGLGGLDVLVGSSSLVRVIWYRSGSKSKPSPARSKTIVP